MDPNAGMVGATCPHIVLTGEELPNMDLDVTPEELRDQFAPAAATRHRMVCTTPTSTISRTCGG